jgi:hypothetical protein
MSHKKGIKMNKCITENRTDYEGNRLEGRKRTEHGRENSCSQSNYEA